MSAESGWSWSDLSGFGSIAGIVLSAIGYVNLLGKQSQSAIDGKKRIEEATETAKVIAKDLSDYKLSAVEKFAPRDHLEAMEIKILHRMDKQDEKFDSSIGRLVQRLDQIIESRSK